MTAKLTGNDLSLFRGDRCLFKRVSFALNSGELLLLEGPNGSGKTSLMRAIAGLLELETGQLLWNEMPLHKERSFFLNAMVWLSHKTGFKGDLTLVENLAFEANLRLQSAVELDDVLKQLRLHHLKRLAMRSLSAGQQRRVALARMQLASADVWMMDEPLSNLDSEGQALAMQMLERHLSRGGMAIVAAHQDVVIDVPMHTISLQ